jgi:hypothetical protein
MGKRTKLEVRYRRPKQEAAQLQQRSQGALSSAQRAQDEQRAAQLLQLLQQVGR